MKEKPKHIKQEVAEYFKLQGKGWQTKINEVLTDYVHSHTENDPGI